MEASLIEIEGYALVGKVGEYKMEQTEKKGMYRIVVKLDNGAVVRSKPVLKEVAEASLRILEYYTRFRGNTAHSVQRGK